MIIVLVGWLVGLFEFPAVMVAAVVDLATLAVVETRAAGNFRC